jgi:hypothetical protein
MNRNEMKDGRMPYSRPEPAPREDLPKLYTADDLRAVARAAYEDAARIVMEARGGHPAAWDEWIRSVTGVAERIAWRAEEDFAPSEPGHGLLPGERLTAHARGVHPLPVRCSDELVAPGRLTEIVTSKGRA